MQARRQGIAMKECKTKNVKVLVQAGNQRGEKASGLPSLKIEKSALIWERNAESSVY